MWEDAPLLADERHAVKEYVPRSLRAGPLGALAAGLLRAFAYGISQARQSRSANARTQTHKSIPQARACRLAQEHEAIGGEFSRHLLELKRMVGLKVENWLG
jgi:hypothetical protein